MTFEVYIYISLFIHCMNYFQNNLIFIYFKEKIPYKKLNIENVR